MNTQNELNENDLEGVKAGLHEHADPEKYQEDLRGAITAEDTKKVATQTTRKKVLSLGDKIRKALGLNRDDKDNKER